MRDNVLDDTFPSVYRAVFAPLEGLLVVAIPNGERLQGAVPVIQLHLALYKPMPGEVDQERDQQDQPSTLVGSERITATLEAFATLMRFSQMLNAKPAFKMFFWERIFQSPMMLGQPWGAVPYDQDYDGETPGIYISESIMEHDAFPRFEIRLLAPRGSEEDTERRRQLHQELPKAPLTAKFMDLLFAFMTAEPTPSSAFWKIRQALPDDFIADLQAAEKPSVGLRFSNAGLTTECLVLLQRFLDQVLVEHQHMRQFGIRLLDLSNNYMEPPELAVLTEIVSTNSVYQIQELVLDRIIDPEPSEETHEGLEVLLAAIFKESLKSASCLRRLSLEAIVLKFQHFAIICSALRYKCSIEELSLADIAGTADDQIWRWLAFGAFHARSVQIAGPKRTLWKLDMSGYNFVSYSVESFTSALVRPIELLTFLGTALDEAEGITLKVCRVKAQSKVYWNPKVDSNPGPMLEDECQLEVISERPGFVCVVLPAVGYGWVEVIQVLTLEASDPVPNRGVLDLKLQRSSLDGEVPEAFGSFLKAIGSMLCGVDLSYNTHDLEDNDTLQGLTAHCPHLQHLVLCAYEMSSEQWARFIESLRGDLGRRLVSLNLNRNNEKLSTSCLATLSELLANPEMLPSLEELRLDVDTMSDAARIRLSEALKTNTRLAFLELQEPDSDPYELSNPRFISREDFEMAHGRMVVVSKTMALSKKLAFLSVLSPRYSEAVRIRSLAQLDVDILTRVFEFSGRRIQTVVDPTSKPPSIPPVGSSRWSGAFELTSYIKGSYQVRTQSANRESEELLLVSMAICEPLKGNLNIDSLSIERLQAIMSRSCVLELTVGQIGMGGAEGARENTEGETQDLTDSAAVATL